MNRSLILNGCTYIVNAAKGVRINDKGDQRISTLKFGSNPAHYFHEQQNRSSWVVEEAKCIALSVVFQNSKKATWKQMNMVVEDHLYIATPMHRCVKSARCHGQEGSDVPPQDSTNLKLSFQCSSLNNSFTPKYLSGCPSGNEDWYSDA